MDQLTRLLEDAREGDRLAWAGFVRATQSEVWRFASRLVGATEADDVTQDIYVRAWRALGAYRGDAAARTWLLAIARRACADAVRRRVRWRRLVARATRHADGTAVAPSAADHAGLWDLVGALSRERREAFVLTQVLGCSYEEAAAVCGVPIGTIRSRVARAREQLLSELRAANAS